MNRLEVFSNDLNAILRLRLSKSDTGNQCEDKSSDKLSHNLKIYMLARGNYF